MSMKITLKEQLLPPEIPFAVSGPACARIRSEVTETCPRASGTTVSSLGSARVRSGQRGDRNDEPPGRLDERLLLAT
ncbi:hypothetical protein ACIRPQ_21275 [Streptomyces sp. NPDC101213]|uniref:hypothetical protein n=1 Tax=Streptomyces sp. NPDC101213 TaxID=3366130 RepID=UPI0037F38A24